MASRLGQPMWLQFIRTWLHPPQMHMNFGVRLRTRSLRSAVNPTDVMSSRNTRDTRYLELLVLLVFVSPDLNLSFNCFRLLFALYFYASSHDRLLIRQQRDQ